MIELAGPVLDTCLSDDIIELVFEVKLVVNVINMVKHFSLEDFRVNEWITVGYRLHVMENVEEHRHDIKDSKVNAQLIFLRILEELVDQGCGKVCLKDLLVRLHGILMPVYEHIFGLDSVSARENHVARILELDVRLYTQWC